MSIRALGAAFCSGILAILAVAPVAAASQQRAGPTAPVDIRHDPVPAIKQFEEATVILKFQALRDVSHLRVSVYGDGVDVRSEPREARFENLKSGDARELTVTVRLTQPERGFLFALATVTYDGQSQSRSSSIPIGMPLPPQAAKEVGTEEDTAQLTFLNGGGGSAVIRFGKKPFELISVGDKVGKNKAEVKAIEAGRLVLEENYIAADGKPNTAEIVIRKGETGGTRYLLRPEKND